MEEHSSTTVSQLSMLLAFPLTHRLLRIVFAGEPEHFTKTQFYILTALYARGELTMTGLAEVIGASKEQATRAVAPLVDMALAERAVSSKNRTRVYVRLTETGADRVRALLDRCAARMRRLLEARLSPAEQAALVEHLTASTELLEKVVKEKM